MTNKRYRGGGYFRGKKKLKNYVGRGGTNLPLNDIEESLKRSKEQQAQMFMELEQLNRIDMAMGYEMYVDGPSQTGWLINMHSTVLEEEQWGSGRSVVELYFLREDGSNFKCYFHAQPYFYLLCRPHTETEVEDFLRKQYGSMLEDIVKEQKEDLDMANHLVGLKRGMLKIVFKNTTDLVNLRKVLHPAALRNQQREREEETIYEDDGEKDGEESGWRTGLDNILELREYDIPFHLRVAMDHDIRVGHWYTVKAMSKQTIVTKLDKEVRPDPVVLAFDIETSKMALKFPDAQSDPIMMISYMIDGQGYLITNREIVSKDVMDFEYTPKPEYEGPFVVFNEPDEKSLLHRFFSHIQMVKPHVFVTYNGDFFDWPYIDKRAEMLGLSMFSMIGFRKDNQDEYKSKYAIHMDCFKWVKRDSYLPVGSQGLKAVTKAKLGYNPVELDAEEMTPMAQENPELLATYSVSDAVATYYLYMKYIHPFIFSLCNIIPLNPDEVLRKGSGTLCETLLMVQSFKAGVIMPNKSELEKHKMYKGHLLQSETYVGGHVEALQSGVFRSDIPVEFQLKSEAFQQLMNQLDRALKFAIETEYKTSLDKVTNYQEVYDQIYIKLMELRDQPTRKDNPLIYHLDVAAMYPNIILTNRLQPSALVEESMCASCDFHKPGEKCQRRMTWSWRGEYLPAKKNEYKMIKNQLELEKFPKGDIVKSFHELSLTEQHTHIEKRLASYCKKMYHKTHEHQVEQRESIVCMRENPFYVNTVRSFRDLRYVYKGKHKEWKQKLEKNDKMDVAEIEECKKMIVLYDSLQLAHKCILNSFYGYVMRKGARWFSMEMAGIVCETGGAIIRMARQLIEQIGKPLELDTDGIWCIFPHHFPENFAFQLNNGKKLFIAYPAVMLNHLVHDSFTNHQYHERKEGNEFEIKSENSIFFEIDGPYKAMILPASKEEGKLLKKRYAVFNEDNTLAELKGFEVKRRGELKLIKVFQEQVFGEFLNGSTLKECYESVACVADRWLDIVFTKGKDLHDTELIDMLCENRSMSKSLEEYGEQKSTSISTAKRLAEFLGDQMVKDKGLNCQFLISLKPAGAPVAERAIPVAILNSDPEVKRHYLRRWLKDTSIDSNVDIRDLLDWEYYKERLASVIMKLITIPAVMQGLSNPVPRVVHPDWVHKKTQVTGKDIRQMLKKQEQLGVPVRDLEDLLNTREVKSTLLPSKKGKGKETIPTMPEGEMPDMHDDYGLWLEWMKQKWKYQRWAKKNEKHHPTTAISTSSPTSIFSLVGKVWKVLYLEEQALFPGEYRMFILVDGNIKSVVLKIPRIFYVNSLVENEAFQQEDKENHNTNNKGIFLKTTTTKRVHPIRKVNYKLPQNHRVHHLYEFELTEMEFMTKYRLYSKVFTHPNVEGVYETQVPLVFRALLQVGNWVQIKQAKQHLYRFTRDLSFPLCDVEQADQGKDAEEEGMEEIYVYHLHQDKRQIVLMKTREKVYAYFVDPSRNAAVPNLSRLFQEAWEQYALTQSDDQEEEEEDQQPLDTPLFESSMFANEKELQKAIKNTVSQFSTQKAYFIVQGDQPWKQGDFCHIYLNLAPADRRCFASLEWTKAGCQHFFRAWFQFQEKRKEMDKLSRYSSIPVGNLYSNKDPFLFVSDVMFARSLKNHNEVLWYSDGEQPDVGGRTNSSPDASFFDAQQPIFVGNKRGAFKTICVTLQVENLDLNAIIESPKLFDMTSGTNQLNPIAKETPKVKEREEEQETSLSSTVYFRSSCEEEVYMASFQLFRHLVMEWSRDALVGEDSSAMKLIQGLHRYLTSCSSKLYDPHITKFVFQAMAKVVRLLALELKKVGASIVYASLTTFVIQTPKLHIDNTLPYISYLLSYFKDHELFRWLQWDPVLYWSYLLWIDPRNYGGYFVPHTDPPEEDQPLQIHPQPYARWNAKWSLPKETHAELTLFLLNFLTWMNEKTQQLQQKHFLMLQEQEQDEDWLDSADFFSSFQLSFLEIIKRIDSHQPPLSLPSIPGCQLSTDNVALECVHFVIFVLQQDPDIKHHVLQMYQSLCQYLKVSSFKSDSNDSVPFANLSGFAYSIPLSCPCCFSFHSLYPCNDETFLSQPPSLSLCPDCGYDYRSLLESSLLLALQRYLQAFSIQDLLCKRCKLPKTSALAEVCSCTGRYLPILSEEEAKNRVSVIASLAQYYSLPLVHDFLSSLQSYL